jgi:hypothetical protein
MPASGNPVFELSKNHVIHHKEIYIALHFIVHPVYGAYNLNTRRSGLTRE